MLLSIQHNFLFVHVAKTGGTSIRAALAPLQRRDPWYWPMFLCSRLSRLGGHRLGIKFPRHAKIVAAREMLPREFFDGLFKFAFVRNPWDLQVSSYHHLRRERPHLVGDRNFKEFLRWKLDPERPYQYHLDTSMALQSDSLVGLHGEMLVDFVGRYERLEEDYQRACGRIQIPPPPLPHRRRADDRQADYRSYYDAISGEWVARHFARDLDLFGYRFDQPSSFPTQEPTR